MMPQSDRRVTRRECLALAGGSLVLRSAIARGVPGYRRSGDAALASEFRRRRQFAETVFGRVAYFEKGGGKAALFLHGFPLNGFHWRGAIERLAQFRRCIAPELLGLGYSEVKGEDVGPSAQAEMLVELLDRLSVGTVDLIANDSGGSIAQIFIARNPGRVRSLLLTNCDVETDSPPLSLGTIIKMARQGTVADEFLLPLLRNKEVARATGLGGHCYSSKAHPSDAAIDYYLSPLLASERRKALVHAYLSALEPNPLTGVGRDLRMFQGPVRIVWGTADTIFSQASAAYLDHLFPASRGVRRVRGGRLFFPEEFPSLVANELRALWEAG